MLKPLCLRWPRSGRSSWLVWAALTGNLSANPLSDLTNETGVWTLRFVCITLAITPLRRLTGWNVLIKFRRMAGLFAFFYGCCTSSTYVIADRFAGLDQAADGSRHRVGHAPARAHRVDASRLAKSVGEDIYKRPFITVGFATWLTMLPLAITSTAGWIRRLGGKRWNLLHRLVYLTGDPRTAALLVAGEGRRQSAADLCGGGGDPARRARDWARRRGAIRTTARPEPGRRATPA